jgi:integrase/recombinase XerD
MASLSSSANVKATRSDGTSFPSRDRAMILLSVKAGLRACKIAKLEWSMVLDARGKVADCQEAFGAAHPMHPDLKRAQC